jgi:hypothetical protein
MGILERRFRKSLRKRVRRGFRGYPVASAQRHRWQFAARFRQSGFGWRSGDCARAKRVTAGSSDL